MGEGAALQFVMNRMTRSQVTRGSSAGSGCLTVPAAPVFCVTITQGELVFLTHDGGRQKVLREGDVPLEAMRYWVQEQHVPVMRVKWQHTSGPDRPADELRTYKDEELLLVGPYTLEGKADPNWPSVMNESGGIGRVPFDRMYEVGRTATVASFARGPTRACSKPDSGM